MPFPGKGIVSDVRARLPYYKDDWIQGCNWGFRVFAPSTYIFFASALPALAFGQQLAMDTEGVLTVVHVLVATAIAGLVQAVIGGQPLLIIGVAEPIVLLYGFMYKFARSAPGLGSQLYLAWCGWVCIWTALMCLLLALSGACAGINRFTRFSGELFGALIAILFFQVGVKGIVHEFSPAGSEAGGATTTSSTSTSTSSSLILLINGLWGLVLAIGVLLTSLKVLQARSWRLGRAWLRGLLADYGVPLMVVVWSALSFAVTPSPGVPRRVETPNTWQVHDSWSVSAQLGEVPGPYVAAALLPAFIISVLFYFDHNVSSQLAQQPEFNLHKPAAYHYDFLLLAALTLLCGLIGIPPVNGVLPQAPMHSRSLAHIRKHKLPLQAAGPAGPAPNAALHAPAGSRPAEQFVAAAANGSSAAQHQGAGPYRPAAAAPSGLQHLELDAAAAAAAQRRSHELRHRALHQSPERAAGLTDGHHQPAALPGSSSSTWQQQQQGEQQQQELRGRALKAIDSEAALNTLPDSAAGVEGRCSSGSAAAHKEQLQQQGQFLSLEVREQRVTNLLQSLLVALCLGVTPAIKLIPTAVLWGYFIFMAVESLAGSQLWERLLLMITDPRKRVDVMQQEHAAYLQLVPYRVVVRFTLLQLVYLLGLWALTTWAGVAGVAFPLPIMALVPVRQYLLPRLFKQQHLAALDAASYDEAPPVTSRQQAVQELYAVGALGGGGTPAHALPVAASAAGGGGGGGGGSSWSGSSLGPDELDELTQEFAGLQLKHHLSPEELEQQRQASL